MIDIIDSIIYKNADIIFLIHKKIPIHLNLNNLVGMEGLEPLTSWTADYIKEYTKYVSSVQCVDQHTDNFPGLSLARKSQ